MRRLLVSHSANPRQIAASLRLPQGLHLTSRVRKRPTQRPQGSPSRPLSQSNTRRVSRSDRHYPNLYARPPPPGLHLDRPRLSNRQRPMRSRLVPLQAVGLLDLHLPVPRSAHSRWRLRHLRRSHLLAPQVHPRNNLRQIRSGLVRAVLNLHLLLYSKVLHLVLEEARLRRRQDHSERPQHRPQRQAIVGVPSSQWVLHHHRRRHHLGLAQ